MQCPFFIKSLTRAWVRETSFPYNSDLVPVADRAISKPRTMPQLRAFAITNLTLYSIILATSSLTDTPPRLRSVGWKLSHPNRMSPEISQINPLSPNGPIIINYSPEKL
uniref:ORF108 protein n=1 Tax=Turritis glabra TaxID=63678 RepID=A0A5H2V434_TURGL|nr:ORF108 protein [Turritis glabra]